MNEFRVYFIFFFPSLSQSSFVCTVLWTIGPGCYSVEVYTEATIRIKLRKLHLHESTYIDFTDTESKNISTHSLASKSAELLLCVLKKKSYIFFNVVGNGAANKRPSARGERMKMIGQQMVLLV